MITGEELARIMPHAVSRVGAFVAPLNGAMIDFDINNTAREAAFLAQIAHESGELRYVRELASGETYDTGRLAVRLGNTPGADGDGQRYKGRGLIQITGRSNYAACGMALGLDLLAHPELLERVDLACRSAGWFWQDRGLNELADKGDFLLITKRINGGTNGWVARVKYYRRAQQVLMGGV